MRSKKNLFFKRIIRVSILSVFAITNVSGQQSLHEVNERWLQQQKEISTSTVLLNNEQGLVPVKDLEQKIASINFGIANANVFDSILNKYTTVNSFSANSADSTFNNLSLDVKFYNTIIVEVAGTDLKDKKILLS